MRCRARSTDNIARLGWPTRCLNPNECVPPDQKDTHTHTFSATHTLQHMLAPTRVPRSTHRYRYINRPHVALSDRCSECSPGHNGDCRVSTVNTTGGADGSIDSARAPEQGAMALVHTRSALSDAVGLGALADGSAAGQRLFVLGGSDPRSKPLGKAAVFTAHEAEAGPKNGSWATIKAMGSMREGKTLPSH